MLKMGYHPFLDGIFRIYPHFGKLEMEDFPWKTYGKNSWTDGGLYKWDDPHLGPLGIFVDDRFPEGNDPRIVCNGTDTVDNCDYIYTYNIIIYIYMYIYIYNIIIYIYIFWRFLRIGDPQVTVLVSIRSHGLLTSTFFNKRFETIIKIHTCREI